MSAENRDDYGKREQRISPETLDKILRFMAEVGNSQDVDGPFLVVTENSLPKRKTISRRKTTGRTVIPFPVNRYHFKENYNLKGLQPERFHLAEWSSRIVSIKDGSTLEGNRLKLLALLRKIANRTKP